MEKYFYELCYEEASKFPEVRREALQFYWVALSDMREQITVPATLKFLSQFQTSDMVQELQVQKSTTAYTETKIGDKNHEKQNVASLRASEFWPVSWGPSQVTGGMD